MRPCPRHKHCAYTGTEPGLCPVCHAAAVKCGGTHGQAPAGSWVKAYGRGLAGPKHPALREGQSLSPPDGSPASHLPPEPAAALPINDYREGVPA